MCTGMVVSQYMGSKYRTKIFLIVFIKTQLSYLKIFCQSFENHTGPKPARYLVFRTSSRSWFLSAIRIIDLACQPEFVSSEPANVYQHWFQCCWQEHIDSGQQLLHLCHMWYMGDKLHNSIGGKFMVRVPNCVGNGRKVETTDQLNQQEFKAWISNYIHLKLWDITIHSCPNVIMMINDNDSPLTNMVSLKSQHE